MKLFTHSRVALLGAFQVFLLVAAMFTVLLTVTPGQAKDTIPSTQLVIQLQAGVAITTINQAYGATLVRPLTTPNSYLVSVSTKVNVELLLVRLASDPRLIYAEVNYAASLTESAQISMWDDQGSALQTGGGTPVSLAQARTQWAFQKINLASAQQLSQGANIKIALLDTGVSSIHPDLNSRLLPGYNTITKTSNVNDDSGHGTFVAGLLAQVAPAAKILPIKVLDSTGRGTVADAAEGLTYAADQGVKVANVSLGVYVDSKTLSDAVKYAQKKGVLVVASAGNDNLSQVRYPAAYSEVLGIAATDQQNQKASFSNYGKEVDLSAPGILLYSTYWQGGYAYGSGTSFAVPQVVGDAALVWALHPDWKAKDVSEQIDKTVIPFDKSSTYGKKSLGAGSIDTYQSCLSSD